MEAERSSKTFRSTRMVALCRNITNSNANLCFWRLELGSFRVELWAGLGRQLELAWVIIECIYIRVLKKCLLVGGGEGVPFHVMFQLS